MLASNDWRIEIYICESGRGECLLRMRLRVIARKWYWGRTTRTVMKCEWNESQMCSTFESNRFLNHRFNVDNHGIFCGAALSSHLERIFLVLTFEIVGVPVLIWKILKLFHEGRRTRISLNSVTILSTMDIFELSVCNPKAANERKRSG